jgi:DNA-binding CsgD family transcriptional regulator
MEATDADVSAWGEEAGMARGGEQIRQQHCHRMAALRAEWLQRQRQHLDSVARFQNQIERHIERRRLYNELRGEVLATLEVFRARDGLGPHKVLESTPPRQVGPFDTERPVRERRGKRGPLTARQREVAALIARGCTNAEIAELLVLTKGTVANHVEHILNRLGFSNRALVAAWAVEQGLLRGER